MEAIGFSISDVIDEVEAAAQETEGQRRQRRVHHCSRFEQFAAKDKPGEDNAVL
jgi:hypothetical protein